MLSIRPQPKCNALPLKNELKRPSSKSYPQQKYITQPDHQVSVFRETSRIGEVTFTVTKTTPKSISITDDKKTEEFNIAFVLPIATYENNPEIKHHMESIESNETASCVQLTLFIEVLLKSNPRENSHKIQDAV